MFTRAGLDGDVVELVHPLLIMQIDKILDERPTKVQRL